MKSTTPDTIPGTIAGNLKEPYFLKDINISGIAGGAGRGGDSIDIYTRLYLTSDDRFFHTTVENLSNVIESVMRANGHHISFKNANCALLVIKPDNSGNLWIDSAAVSVKARLKKLKAQAGTVLFDKDIADITGMDFPCVDINSQDRVIYFFREGWRFGFFCDLNPDADYRERI